MSAFFFSHKLNQEAQAAEFNKLGTCAFMR